jgi:hypothetical protein
VISRAINGFTGIDKINVYSSLSQYFYPGGTLEIIFRSQGTPA